CGSELGLEYFEHASSLAGLEAEVMAGVPGALERNELGNGSPGPSATAPSVDGPGRLAERWSGDAVGAQHEVAQVGAVDVHDEVAIVTAAPAAGACRRGQIPGLALRESGAGTGVDVPARLAEHGIVGSIGADDEVGDGVTIDVHDEVAVVAGVPAARAC